MNNKDINNLKFKLVYPKWKKLPGQTTFNLPPHGPVVFAASLPTYVDVSFTDENVEEIDFNEECDFVGISMMLSTQVKRGWEIADEFRRRGKKVIFGGFQLCFMLKKPCYMLTVYFWVNRKQEWKKLYKIGKKVL
jgi:hypothetical protein